jgi:ERCC4-type nuclease
MVRKALPAGDYSVLGLETRVSVERKSLIDAYGTFGGGRDRFERELEKLSKMEFAAVVIEAGMASALLRPPKEVQKFTPKHFNRAWICWAQRYRVHFLFCDSRALAQRQTYILLERFWRDVSDGKR